MEKKEIINLKSIPQSAKKESSYKNFPIPEIIYKPNNKIFLLPRIKYKRINIEFYNKISKNKENDKNNDKDNIKNNKKEEELCLPENNKNKTENSKNQIHNVIMNSKNYPKLKSLSINKYKNNQMKNLKLKNILNQNNMNIQITEENNSNRNIRNLNINLYKKLPKITLSSDKMFNKFRDGMSRLREKPLEVIANKNLITINNIKNKNKNDIFETTETFPTIKLGCKYDPEDRNTTDEEEKIWFSEKLKDMINKICTNKIKSRNLKNKNCYEILDDIKKKKTYDCEKLIEKTTEEVKEYKKQIIHVYKTLRKNFEESDERNNLDNFYNVD